MRRSTVTEERIAMVLRHHDAGTIVGENCRKLEISETTFFAWRNRFGGVFGTARAPSDIRTGIDPLILRRMRFRWHWGYDVPATNCTRLVTVR